MGITFNRTSLDSQNVPEWSAAKRLAVGLLSCSLICLLATTARAAEYHVSPQGSDGGNGTAERPWKTLATSIRKLKAGDELTVHAGTYREIVLVNGLKGTADQPIRIQAEGPVTVDPSIQLTEWQQEGDGIYSTSVGIRKINVVWDGDRMLLGPHFEWYGTIFRHPTPTTLQPEQCMQKGDRLYVRLRGDRNPGTASVRATVENCIRLRDTDYTVWTGINAQYGLNGYKLENGSSNNTISDAEIQTVYCGVLEVGPSKTEAGCAKNSFLRLRIHDIGITKYNHGIYTNGRGTRIVGCDFRAISGASIHAYPAPEDSEYLNNTISNPLEPHTEADFRGERAAHTPVGYTAIVCAGKGNRIAGNVINGSFDRGISLTAEGTEITRNKISLDRGIGVDTASRGADARITDNEITTSGYYFSGLLNGSVDKNTFRGKGSWRIGSKIFRNLSDLERARQ